MEPKPIPYHDLIRALTPDVETAHQGCPICHLVTESVARYLDDLIFFSAVKPDTRAEIRVARGFCNEHASQLAQLTGKGLGVALIHEDIIDTVMEGLQSAAPRPTSALLKWPAGSTPTKTRTRRAAARAVQALAPQGSCLACQHQLLVEESYLGTLWRYLDDEALAAALRASPGLCLPHLRQALPGSARCGRAAAADRDSNRMSGAPARRAPRARPASSTTGSNTRPSEPKETPGSARSRSSQARGGFARWSRV